MGLDGAVNVPLKDSVVNLVKYAYFDLWEEVGDPRVAHFPLMRGGPWPTIAIVFAYIYFVKVFGPKCMKSRQPFDLRVPIFIYNCTLILWNLYFFYYFATYTNFGLSTWICVPPDPNAFDDEWRFKIKLAWLFYISKFVDLVDTVFFVLRKKSEHISTLHVCHHSLMPINIWLGLKLVPSPSSAFVPVINSLVHAIMYSYYALSTLGPRVRPYLWWKKHLTAVQIIQISLALFHIIYIGLVPACSVPRLLFVFALIQGTFILTLFCLFYIKSYLSMASKSRKARKSL